RYSIGAKVWMSDGESTWSQNASAISTLLGDPSSKLTYKNLRSNVLEINGNVELPRQFFLAIAYGKGDIDDGILTDDDFLSALGADFFGTTVGGQHRFSRTRSDVDGDDLDYVNLTFGRAIVRSTDQMKGLNLFATYQRWTERYIAQGVEQLTCTAPNVLCQPAGFVGFVGDNAISNEAKWRSLFVGADGYLQLNHRVKLHGQLAYTPIADLSSQDVHFLRADLRKDPSFSHSGRGTGINAEIGAEFRINRNFYATAGIRYWQLKAEDESGGFRSNPIGSAPIKAELNEFKTERKGLVLGIVYRPSAH
ncbi:MAG: hypothetical protein OEU36_05555, partial [Gammaproteobacteria bacterium]|nr:hypothetical protein [Gammaproteobacteria bacterium]